MSTLARSNVTPAGHRRRLRSWGVLAALAALSVLASACAGDPDGELGESVASAPEQPELVLEAALSPGDDPFTASGSDLDADDVSAAESVDHPTVEIDGAVDPAEALAAVEGGGPGLYGGSGDESACDVGAISAELAADPDKAQAWADAQGIGVHGIDPFLDTLTPVVLLHDTRVTNHGYRDGVANPFQSVLQAGTAVLVDPMGVPRVRCACGNPLAEPDTSVVGEPVGTPWSSYGATPVVTVVPADPITVFVVVNIHTGQTEEIPAGNPTRPPSPETPGTPPESSGEPVDPTIPTDDLGEDPGEGPVPERDATTCLSRYGELVVLMTPLGLDPLQASQWAPRAQQAAALVDAGQYDEAGEIICTLVDEMETEYQNLLAGG